MVDKKPAHPTISELLDATSRTFALGIHQLPSDLERPVAVAYLLLRVSDYLEDNELMAPEEKLRQLHAWISVLQEKAKLKPDFGGVLQESLPDSLAIAHVDRILRAFNRLPERQRSIIRHHVVASTEGMARWLRRGCDIATEEDLNDYMFEVAGRVGLLLTEMFARHRPSIARHEESLRSLGVEFGLGLQTVNVIRGLNSDPDRGWVFIPRSFVPTGKELGHLWNAPQSPQAAAALARLVAKAERHLDGAREYVLRIPRREYGIRVFCLLPLFLAAGTLAITRDNPAVFHQEVKLPRERVRRIVALTRVGACSNTWIRYYHRRLS